MTTPPSPMDDQSHKFNSDLLQTQSDREKARQNYPLVAEAFIDDNLIARFTKVDDQANQSKRRSRWSGWAAVVLAMLSLMGLSASPLYHHAREPWPVVLDGLAALSGLASMAIAYFGILHSGAKERWLVGRWQTERMRQFHFQYNVAHLRGVLAASDPEQPAKFRTGRAEALTQLIPTDEKQLRQRLSKTLASPGEDVWLIPEPKAIPSNFTDAERVALNEFFNAYLDLRIRHQKGYAEHVLGKKRGPLRWTLNGQQRWFARLGLGCVLILFVLHLIVVFGGLLQWEALRNLSHSPWTHTICIWIVAVAMGGRVIEDGYGLRFDAARYADYLANLSRIEKAYTEDCSFDSRLQLVRRTEDLVFTEMVSFLRTATHAQYVS